MKDELKFPPVPRELVEVLDKRFPERCPDPTMTEREIWMMAGERRLVRLLKAELERQTPSILKDHS